MDIVISNPVYTVPGGIIRMDQPGQRLRAASGLSVVTIVGAVYITPEAAGAIIDASIKILMPVSVPQAGAIQCAASNARINCEIDLNGTPTQGVQILKYPSIPYDCNLDNLYVYNNSLGDDPTAVGYNHGIYNQDGVRVTGKNMRFKNIKGGYGIQFYPDAHDSIFDQITFDSCYGDIICWANSSRNKVMHGLSINVGSHGIITVGGGTTQTANDFDIVSTPTPGYGYQGTVPPVVKTPAQLAQEAEDLFKATTISYPEWLKRVKSGAYNPKDGSTTNWGKALALLDQIELT